MREEETPGKHSWHQWTWHHTGAKLKTLNVETRDFQNKTASMARHELGLVSLSEILRPACLTPTTTVWTSAAHLDHAFYANISLICMLRFMPYTEKKDFPLNPSFNTLMFLLYLPPQEIQEVFKMITTRQHQHLNTMTTMTTMPPLTTTTVTAQEPHSIATVNNRSSTLQYWQPYLCFLCVFLVTMAHNATNSTEDNEVSATTIIPNEVQ